MPPSLQEGDDYQSLQFFPIQTLFCTTFSISINRQILRRHYDRRNPIPFFIFLGRLDHPKPIRLRHYQIEEYHARLDGTDLVAWGGIDPSNARFDASGMDTVSRGRDRTR